jgi:hypothetical protein
MKFKIGEKVIVKTYTRMPINWNHDMMMLMGKTVTIRSNRAHDNYWPYTIEEDPQWVWREKDFRSLLTDFNDPNYVFMRKKKGNSYA